MNLTWAKEIVHQLISQGVNYFCLSPGSRITPLAIAIAENDRAQTFIHYDERGSAFHALGAARASGSPVAILTTSGTAIGNIMPAVMEASLSRIPLLLLTADRPPELREVSANQTIDQVKLFSNYVRWQFELPCPDSNFPDRFLATTMAQAVHLANAAPKGPVHINCMFREPFFTNEPLDPTNAPLYYEQTTTIFSEKRLQYWREQFSEMEQGIIIVGSLHTQDLLYPIIKLAETLDWPILADIDSGLRSYGNIKPIIPFYDLIFKTQPDLPPCPLLQFGDRLVSKSLLEWIGRIKPTLYCHVSEHPFRADPKHSVTHRIPCDPCYFAEEIQKGLSSKSSWLPKWKDWSNRIKEKIKIPSHEISEPGITRWLLEHIPQDYAFFFANGMPVRDADTFFYPQKRTGPVFTNRGVSGIDGNIATIAGLCEGSKRPLIAIIGDQTALHDLNSIAQLKKTTYPIILIIINNAGSGMFSFLPVFQNTPIHLFEEYFASSHNLNFEHAALLFGLSYYKPESWEELSEVPLTQSCIIELTTNRDRNLTLHQEITDQLFEYENCRHDL